MYKNDRTKRLISFGVIALLAVLIIAVLSFDLTFIKDVLTFNKSREITITEKDFKIDINGTYVYENDSDNLDLTIDLSSVTATNAFDVYCYGDNIQFNYINTKDNLSDNALTFHTKAVSSINNPYYEVLVIGGYTIGTFDGEKYSSIDFYLYGVYSFTFKVTDEYLVSKVKLFHREV